MHTLCNHHSDQDTDHDSAPWLPSPQYSFLTKTTNTFKIISVLMSSIINFFCLFLNFVHMKSHNIYSFESGLFNIICVRSTHVVPVVCPLTLCVLVTQLCPTLWDPHGLWPARFLCPWDCPGKNTGVGSCSLLQGIFWTQGLSPGLPNCRQFFTIWATREAFSSYVAENNSIEWVYYCIISLSRSWWMFGLFAVSHIRSKFAISTSPIAFISHFCSHRPHSRRAQRIYLYLALLNAVKGLPRWC